MASFRLFIVFLILSLSSGVFGAEDDELKAVIVLFRHGDRAPLSSWPNDIYFGDSSLWPDGYGQLNNLGKQRHYRLGQWFRNRYDGFLPSRYNRSDIYVRSTDVDRTLMSAASNLAGLYPPSDDQIWNDNIPWQAIPIHTIPVLEDHLLVAAIPCPKRDRLTQELYESEEILLFLEEYSDLFLNISEVTGFSSDEINLKEFANIFTAITVYREFNLSLPSWTEYYWPDIKFLAAKGYQLATYTEDLARLRSGPFFDYLLDHLYTIRNQYQKPKKELIKDEDITAPKLLMLSSHETTLSDVTNSMGVFAGAVPEFASTVIWELKNKNGIEGDFYLNLYYKNSTHFSPLTIPGCDVDCDLDKFAEILKPVPATVDQWTQECNEG